MGTILKGILGGFNGKVVTVVGNAWKSQKKWPAIRTITGHGSG
jgi:hypothetical protein